MIVNHQSGTRIDEVADGTYRISTPVPPSEFPGGFSFNQYLIVDDQPLLFHTGMKSLFPWVSEAIETVFPLSQLRHIAFSHVEADECGALDAFLAAAPAAAPLCSTVAANISLRDSADRAPRGLADGEVVSLGAREIVWIDAPHVPHNWETGFVLERTTGTLLCGDLFTHGGDGLPPLTASDILAPAEAFRAGEAELGLPPSWGLGPATRSALLCIAAYRPTTLACMHGSAWHGSADLAVAMLNGLADALVGPERRLREPERAA
jgi:glyoxylase-like metal-dependent hydrolase (beta-lactamase superfamily II)